MTADPRAVLLRDVFDDPDDDLPRLVLGDLLADQGDPRGEFIQIDVRLAAGVADDAERARLEARRREILARHALNWLGPLVDLASSWEFRRGFLHLTIRGVKLADVGVAHLPPGPFGWVVGVRMIDFHARQWRAAGVAAFLAGFGALDLSDSRLGNEAVERLIAHDPGRLRQLDLGGNRVGDWGVEALSSCEGFGRLRSLGLRQNSFGEAGALALIESPHLAGLRSLDVRGCRLLPETRAELRQRFGDRVRLDRG